MPHIYAVNAVYYYSTVEKTEAGEPRCIEADSGAVFADMSAEDFASLDARGAVRLASTAEVLDAGLTPIPNVPAPAQTAAVKKVKKAKGDTESADEALF